MRACDAGTDVVGTAGNRRKPHRREATAHCTFTANCVTTTFPATLNSPKMW